MSHTLCVFNPYLKDDFLFSKKRNTQYIYEIILILDSCWLLLLFVCFLFFFFFFFVVCGFFLWGFFVCWAGVGFLGVFFFFFLGGGGGGRGLSYQGYPYISVSIYRFVSLCLFFSPSLLQNLFKAHRPEHFQIII